MERKNLRILILKRNTNTWLLESAREWLKKSSEQRIAHGLSPIIIIESTIDALNFNKVQNVDFVVILGYQAPEAYKVLHQVYLFGFWSKYYTFARAIGMYSRTVFILNNLGQVPKEIHGNRRHAIFLQDGGEADFISHFLDKKVAQYESYPIQQAPPIMTQELKWWDSH